MTLPGHSIFSLLLFMLLGFPFNWIFIFLSHFILDKYPDFYSKEYLKDKKEVLYNFLFFIGVILNYSLIFIIFYKLFHLPIKIIMIITIIAMFPDITEGIYLGIKFIMRKKEWPDKFWFNHDGFFPFKWNNWQFSTKTFRCFSRKQTILIDFIFIIVISIILFLLKK